VYYSITTPTAGFIRITIDNATGSGTSWLELIGIGGTCGVNTCTRSAQMTLSTGTFSNGLNSWDFDVTAPGTYYIAIDAQGAGSILNYDISANCYASGIRIDTVNDCGSGWGTGNDNQGVYTTWNGSIAPDFYDASLGGTFTVCENFYLRNIGWEWLKYLEVTAGECWTGVRSISPDANFRMYADHNPSCPPERGWNGTTSGDIASWTFQHPNRTWDCADVSAWGDGHLMTNNFTCGLYTFCFTADVDPLCTNLNGLKNIISGTDDGIGGGGSTLPSNFLITYPWAQNSSTLPVSLIDFSSLCMDNSVIIKWTTASEINNDYFTLERSVNSYQFEPIAFIEGAGNSNDIVRYAYEDDKLPYAVYYRLKQTDFDGTSAIGKIIAVQCGEVKELNLNIADHNDEGYIIASFNSTSGKNYIVSLTDANGKIVYLNSMNVEEDFTQHRISTLMFAQGIYVINIVSDDHNYVKKILIK